MKLAGVLLNLTREGGSGGLGLSESGRGGVASVAVAVGESCSGHDDEWYKLASGCVRVKS